MVTRPGQAKEDLQQAGGVLVKDGGLGREKACEEVGRIKSGIADRLTKANRQNCYSYKKESPLTFDVNEGTYMDYSKHNVQKCIFRKYILGIIGDTVTLCCPEFRTGICGGQNWAKVGGLGGPRNTTLYKKNG